MDHYFYDENIEIFKRWVFYRIKKFQELELYSINNDTYEIHYQNKVALFVVWKNGIIEETIRENDDVLFYLHFKFHDYKYGTDLFNRMLDKLLEDSTNKQYRVLLCCSSGLTTGYFADRANQYCKLNQLPYVIKASSIEEAPYIYKQYQMVLFAPQIQHSLYTLKEKLKDIEIRMIEASIFATYDCAKLIQLIEETPKDVSNL